MVFPLVSCSVAVGAIVVGGAKIAHDGLYVLFSKDSFIHSLERGMSEYQKEMFQREIEDMPVIKQIFS